MKYKMKSRITFCRLHSGCSLVPSCPILILYIFPMLPTSTWVKFKEKNIRIMFQIGTLKSPSPFHIKLSFLFRMVKNFSGTISDSKDPVFSRSDHCKRVFGEVLKMLLVIPGYLGWSPGSIHNSSFLQIPAVEDRQCAGTWFKDLVQYYTCGRSRLNF